MLTDAMPEEEIVNIGVVDVDFATDLGEGDEALVAVVLPCVESVVRGARLRLRSLYTRVRDKNKSKKLKGVYQN